MPSQQRSADNAQANTTPAAGDNISGLSGWPKVLANFGMIGLICILMATLVLWQHADARSDREMFNKNRDASLKEANEAHRNVDKLVHALEKQTRAIEKQADSITTLAGEVRKQRDQENVCSRRRSE